MAVSGFTSLSRSRRRLGVRPRVKPRRRLRPLRRWLLASVRARTTALSMLVVAAALGVCAVNLVVIVSRSLVRNADETNMTRAEDVAARARTGALGRIIPVSGGASDKSVFIQVVDQAGSVVASSENYLDPNAFIYVYPEDDSHHRVLFQHTVHGPPLAPRANFRVLVLTGQTPTGPANIIVATEMAQAEETVHDLRRALAYGAPGVLLLAGLLVWLLVGRALRPVEDIRTQVAAITDTASLDRRVAESLIDDEVGRLAQTMNAMLDRLHRSAERQRRFVADASHELRSPLASSRAQLEVALSHPTASDWAVTAEDLLSENQRMERLVNDLLFLARNEERPAGLARATSLDLDDIVLAEAGRVRARGRVQVDLSRVSAGRVRGVADHLTRVVRNLLENAERHAETRIRVELSPALATGRGAQVQLVVSDDGPGVPAQHREHIFDRFIRLDDARTRPHGDYGGGSGLGLAICREIVTAHGGRIWADEARGGGARFVVQIPAD
ncbi:MAG TPA: HAMP domain-containing sensor histidine kinase [Acidimicrobiia bacterium]